MADRIVNGNTNTENGWRLVDTGSCTWVQVPGTDVTLQIREGQPAAIMGAFAADFNAYVEPLRDADSACYTESNSVLGTPGHNNGSNHMSATAMDLNWGSHPFRQANAGFNAGQIATVREMLAFYENTIFWGNDWDNPKDSMHFQMGYDTYGSENVARVQGFIARKIRADGFSTFRRGGTQAPPPSPTSKADLYALEIIAEGRRRGVTPRGIQIALSVALVESNLQMYANASVPESLNIPHDKVGSDHDSVGLFQQRCPMWGPAEVLMNPALSAGLFYDRLVKMDYNNTSRPPGDYAADVQRPAAQYRGRYQERMGDAVALYDRLANTVDPLEELLMSNLEVESLSLYATPGEPNIPIVRMVQSIDAAAHRKLVEDAARLGDSDALARIARVAAGQGKYRDQGAINHALGVLAEINGTTPADVKKLINAQKGQS